MKKLFCTSDVHSYFDELMIALNQAGFDINNEEHIFVCCGDLLDRGGFPTKCIKFVNNLPDNRKILIRGNHEVLADDVIHRGYFGWHDWHNGTAETVQFLSEYPASPFSVPEAEVIESFAHNPDWVKYFNSTVYYKEVGDYIFTHGWIPCGGTKDYPVYEANWREKSFNEAVWYNGMAMWNEGVRVPGKTVVCGHFHAAWGNQLLHDLDPENTSMVEFNSTFKDNGILALDSRVPATHFLNVEVLEVEDDIF